jgi:enamine deaminase RidA (YjgF/YER057c/UK114 family)
VQVFENLGRALPGVGATFADVVSTSMYVTDLSHVAILREVRTRYLPTEAPGKHAGAGGRAVSAGAHDRDCAGGGAAGQRATTRDTMSWMRSMENHR